MNRQKPPKRKLLPSSKLNAPWEEETLFFKGDDYFTALLRDINLAKKSISFETYIYDNDQLADKITDALIEASERGVYVRLAVDGIGSSDWADDQRDLLIRSKVRVKTFHPLPWKLIKTVKFMHLQSPLTSIIAQIRRLNWRNHRKMIIIDGKIGFVGSINITANHSEQYSGKNAWRDTAVRVTGPQVRKLVLAFDHQWFKGQWRKWKWRNFRDEHFYPLKQTLVRVNDTLWKRRYFSKDILTKIRRARQRVWITSPYFLPSRAQMRALFHANRRGADVRILVGKKSDVTFFNWLHPIIYHRLSTQGIKVYEYLPRIIHAKNILIDQWTIVGSSNFNNRSLKHDLEVDIVINHPENVQLIVNQYREDYSMAELVTIEQLSRIPRWRMWVGRLLLLFRYWF